MPRIQNPWKQVTSKLLHSTVSNTNLTSVWERTYELNLEQSTQTHHKLSSSVAGKEDPREHTKKLFNLTADTPSQQKGGHREI